MENETIKIDKGYIAKFQGKEINIKHQLSLTEAIQYVDTVSSTVCNLEQGTYTPVYEELVRITTFLSYYTDMKQPDLEEIYANLSEYQEWVLSLPINSEQNYDLNTAIIEEIEFKKQMLIHNQKSSLDNLLNTINDIIVSMKDSLNIEELTPVLQKLGNMGEINEKNLVQALIDSKVISNKAPRKKSTKKVEKVETNNVVNESKVVK